MGEQAEGKDADVIGGAKKGPHDELLLTHPSDMMLPDTKTFELQHELSLPDSLITPERRAAAKMELLQKIEADEMAPYYKYVCETFDIPLDEALLERLQAANQTALVRLDAAMDDSEQNYGDVEIRDAMYRKSHFLCRIGDKDAAIASYSETFDKTVGSGTRLDIINTLIRMGICFGDQALTKQNLERAKSELERGGDWERMNKLKVYEAIQLMSNRNFKAASNLLLDSVATFTASEIISFESFIFYAVIVAMLTLERPLLKTKVVNSPEILQVLSNDVELREFLKSFYQCDYATFMNRLIPISLRVRRDKFFGRHSRYFVRNIRLRAYVQFLEPYKSVTLSSMSRAFAVPVPFIEEEISSFISGGRLNSKIDRVNGIIESDHPDARNALYLQTLKQGDALLNKIQKLSRVIDM